ncbi:MAG: helix-turn-helix domain-containing protein [Actinobacteria bacterium]|nr:helix-turn-helix domain-containing protein [Actinomycetota bacterium]NIU70045.1 helix-turn-helix domain-containing protein [Actinomycetota bacterium]NIX24179.1 helix-turn-helix domain-containing protein [Actinomycetota bacterium]
MSRPASRLAAAALLVVLVAAAAPAAGQSAAESTVLHVALEPDGDARWTVSARFAVEGENETAAFERLAREYVDGETDALSADPYREAAALASESTGREMAIRDVERAASLANGTGALRLSFTWTNFTRVAEGGDRLVLGDVFRTPSGTWLPRLGDDQALVIQFPEGYVVESVSRGLDNRSMRVSGPATFEPGEPSATLVRGVPASPSPPSQGVGVPSALTAGGVLAVLLVGAYALYRRRQEAAEGDAATPGAGGEPDDGEEPPADELLSDEERVLRLLRAEGGRMKQVDIVEATDWSNAKVSQLLSSMAEAGEVEKLRIGRENLISLPDDGDD